MTPPPPALPEEPQRLIETFAEACYAVGQDSEIAGTKAIERSATYRDETKAALVSGIAALVQRVTDAETRAEALAIDGQEWAYRAGRKDREAADKTAECVALTVRAETAERARDALKQAAAYVVQVWHDEMGQLGPSIHALDLAVRGATPKEGK